MRKRNIYLNQSQELLNLFEDAGNNSKVMCVPMDYAKKDHIVMFCDGNAIFLRNPFPSETTQRGLNTSPTR